MLFSSSKVRKERGLIFFGLQLKYNNWLYQNMTSGYLKELQSSVDNLVKFTFPLYSSFVLPEDFMQTLFCYF